MTNDTIGSEFVQAEKKEEIRQIQRTAAELHKMSQLLVDTAEDVRASISCLNEQIRGLVTKKGNKN